MTDTISWTELVRTVCYLLALIFTIKIFMSAAWDLFVLRIKRINSIREYAAITTVICFGVFGYMNFVFVVAGVNSMTIPSPYHQMRVQIVNSILYVSASIMSCVASFMIERRRRELRRKIAEFEDYN